MKNKFIRLFLLVALVSLSSLTALYGAGKNEEPRILTVSASGTRKVKPDTALVRLGVETRSPEVRIAFDQNSATIESIRQALFALGIEESNLASINYSVYFESPYVPDPRLEEVKGSYRVQNGLAVQVKILEAVGKVVDAAVEAGANQLWGIEFGVTDRETAEDEARELAVRNAEKKAKTIADATGLKIKRIRTIEELGASTSTFDQAFQLKHLSSVMDSPSSVSPGEAELLVTVQIRYEVE